MSQTNTCPDIEQLRSLVAEDVQAADALIKSRLYCGTDLINRVGDYILSSGGKRLRPLITILCAKAAGYKGKKHIDVAVILELVHTATLLHDDVVDASKLRRGRKTVNVRYGNEASVLLGDYLLSISFEILTRAGNLEVLETISSTTQKIALGQILEVSIPYFKRAMFFSILIIPFPSLNSIFIPINKDPIIFTFFIKMFYIFFLAIFIPSSPFSNRNMKLFYVIKSDLINIISSLLFYLSIWMIDNIIL